jgi:fermentation-respiration switch protein FrsA (DUF1100 family)
VHAVATFACPAEFDFMAGGQTAGTLISRFREIGIIKDKDFPPSLEKWLEGFKIVAPIEYVDKISPKPLLLVHGDQDEVVPVAHAEKLFGKAGQPKELVMLPGAGHRLRQDQRAIDAAMKWLINVAA